MNLGFLLPSLTYEGHTATFTSATRSSICGWLKSITKGGWGPPADSALDGALVMQHPGPQGNGEPVSAGW